MNALFRPLLAYLCASSLLACSDAEEAPRVELGVVVDSTGLAAVENDLGYQVEVSEARVVVEDFEFTIAGEVHVSLWRRIADLVVPVAHAHPGHSQGGEVTGELPGRFVLRFAPGAEQELGTATLLAGTYESANFTFAVGAATDGLADDDALLGHTAILSGAATNESGTWSFEVLLDSPEGRQLVGAPFEYEVRKSSDRALGVRFSVRDPLEGDTLFDGVDFAALDGDGDGKVSIEPAAVDEATRDAYNTIHRDFQTHDHFDVRPQP